MKLFSKKTGKKTLALVLTLVMMLGVLPMVAIINTRATTADVIEDFQSQSPGATFAMTGTPTNENGTQSAIVTVDVSEAGNQALKIIPNTGNNSGVIIPIDLGTNKLSDFEEITFRIKFDGGLDQSNFNGKNFTVAIYSTMPNNWLSSPTDAAVSYTYGSFNISPTWTEHSIALAGLNEAAAALTGEIYLLVGAYFLNNNGLDIYWVDDIALWLYPPDPRIDIDTQPALQANVIQGNAQSFLTVAASGHNGATPLSYQWYRNTTMSNVGGTLIQGATSTSFNIPSTLTIAGSPYFYYCVVSAPQADSVTTRASAVVIRASVECGTELAEPWTQTFNASTQLLNAPATAVAGNIGIRIVNPADTTLGVAASGLQVTSTDGTFKGLLIEVGGSGSTPNPNGVLNGSDNYWNATNGFVADPGATYKVSVTASVASGTGQMRIRGNSGGDSSVQSQGSFNLTTTPTTFSRTFNQSIVGGNILIDTGNTPQGVAMRISQITIYEVCPGCDEYPCEEEGGGSGGEGGNGGGGGTESPDTLIYEMTVANRDEFLEDGQSGGGLRSVGDAEYKAEGNGLLVSNRTRSWEGLDIMASVFTAGKRYRVEVVISSVGEAQPFSLENTDSPWGVFAEREGTNNVTLRATENASAFLDPQRGVRIRTAGSSVVGDGDFIIHSIRIFEVPPVDVTIPGHVENGVWRPELTPELLDQIISESSGSVARINLSNST
ncbi:MAG: hypothetical protein LBC71_03110, partial [Oscillospiraceae bacterium]|nr:hypothetical protein [Oscillospiraceae bacterium]